MHSEICLQQHVPLKQMVERLLISYQGVAQIQHSYFVNDIGDELSITTDTNLLSTLLGSLLYMTARCSRETRLRISARKYSNVVVLAIEDSSGLNNYEAISSMRHIRVLANKLGSVIDFPRPEQSSGFFISLPLEYAA